MFIMIGPTKCQDAKVDIEGEIERNMRVKERLRT